MKRLKNTAAFDWAEFFISYRDQLKKMRIDLKKINKQYSINELDDVVSELNDTIKEMQDVISDIYGDES
jgi:ppGpp synthetase/RelA/SpoT-type nucleotidyltranferase